MDLQSCLSLDEFRRELETCDEASIIGQILIQHGALHALNHLVKVGCTKEKAEGMIDDVETNCGIIEQIAASRGIDLPVRHLP